MAPPLSPIVRLFCLLLPFVFRLCTMIDGSDAKLAINAAAHHREHKVHNIVLYPDKHSWCQTTTIKQVLNFPGCTPVEIDNNVCVGACFSYSIPHTEPSDPGEVIVPYCDSCQPSATTWHQITLQCDESKADIPTPSVKHVQIIKNCSCSSCEERLKIGNKVTYNVVDDENGNGNTDFDDVADNAKVANELLLLQNLHATNGSWVVGNIGKGDADSVGEGGVFVHSPLQAGQADKTKVSAGNERTHEHQHGEVSEENSRSKRMHRVLNQKVGALLADIERDNRHSDKEHLRDVLYVAQHDLGGGAAARSAQLQMTDIVKSLQGEEALSVHDVQRIRDYMQKLQKFRFHLRPEAVADIVDVEEEVADERDEDDEYGGLRMEQWPFEEIDGDDHDEHENEQPARNVVANDSLGDGNASSHQHQHQPVVEITDIVQQLGHQRNEDSEMTADRHQQHVHHSAHQQRHHHQQHQHHEHHLSPKQESERAAETTSDGGMNTAASAHHHSRHQETHHQYAEQHSLAAELPPDMPQETRAQQLREQLDVNAHDLKPNHAGTLLSYKAGGTK